MDSVIGVQVRGIAAGGSGVADLPDGRVVFVPRTAPGDRASIRLVKDRSSWALGVLEHLDEPSVERRPPLCSRYTECGGCQLQHLPYAEQLRWKGQIVADALERIGGIEGMTPPDVVPSPKEMGYRNRISYTLRRLRGGRLVAGFHALGRPAHVVDIHNECVLPRPRLAGAWRALRSAWGPGARLLPQGGRLRLTVRETSEGVALLVDGGEDGWSATALARAVPELNAIWHLASGASKSGPRLLEGAFDEGGPEFAQVNSEAASLLRAHVTAVAGEAGQAVDAYCGAGAFGRDLATQGWTVVGIERDPAACDGALRHAPEGFTVRQGSVESLLADCLPADLLILNPPRAGVGPESLRTVLDSGPSRVVYVSCDPATLARDVAGLGDRYEVDDVRCFDLFPQTAHVETVLVMTARESSG